MSIAVLTIKYTMARTSLQAIREATNPQFNNFYSISILIAYKFLARPLSKKIIMKWKLIYFLYDFQNFQIRSFAQFQIFRVCTIAKK